MPQDVILSQNSEILCYAILALHFCSQLFLCPRDDSQGALRFAPVCLSVCPSVRPFVTLYGIEFV